eukprot:CAMPEP_0116828712 /NCGR_PEP_ID=MMETSP0418-20121206/3798_1 /TAXON_ID=1158023 /ORGANISM="Astrosyne radiata, Strain 13vi08-1A" /LENGTH=84 /DNA_ID=CAMNT_0004457611 /DNA_START=338 /DNA_END=592 /DNA_ORIENTATION=+
MPSMLQARDHCVAVSMNGKHLVVLGGGIEKSTEALTTDGKTFMIFPEMSEPRDGLTTAADETAIYAVGGFGSKSAEMFSSEEKK